MNSAMYTIGLFTAQAAPTGAGGGGSTIMLIGWLAIVFAIFYFMAILPQRRREKERKKLLDAIKTGDRVIFGGGLIGTVANVKDPILVVKVAEGVKLEVLRGAVTRIVEKEDELKTAESN